MRHCSESIDHLLEPISNHYKQLRFDQLSLVSLDEEDGGKKDIFLLDFKYLLDDEFSYTPGSVIPTGGFSRDREMDSTSGFVSC